MSWPFYSVTWESIPNYGLRCITQYSLWLPGITVDYAEYLPYEILGRDLFAIRVGPLFFDWYFGIAAGPYNFIEYIQL